MLPDGEGRATHADIHGVLGQDQRMAIGVDSECQKSQSCRLVQTFLTFFV